MKHLRMVDYNRNMSLYFECIYCDLNNITEVETVLIVQSRSSQIVGRATPRRDAVGSHAGRMLFV
jgi:hypothetical protein